MDTELEPAYTIVRWENSNTKSVPCHICRPFIGKLFHAHTIPQPPLHPSCYCFVTNYVNLPGDEQKITTELNMDELSEDSKRALRDYADMLQKQGLPIPDILAPFVANTPPPPYDPEAPGQGSQAERIELPLRFDTETTPNSMTAVLVEAGPTRTLSGKPGRFSFTGEALDDAQARGLFENLSCFLDHHDKPSVRNLFGVWHHAAYYAGQIRAQLRPFQTDANTPTIQLLRELAALPEAQRPDIGVSIVAHLEADNHGRITKIHALESADIVSFPAVPTARFLLAADEQPHQEGDLNETPTQTVPAEWAQQPDPAWDKAYRATAANAIINNSDLPALTRERLQAGDYATPEAVFKAIDSARAELAALHEAGVIQMPGRPRVQVSDPLEEAINSMGYFFGLEGAQPLPLNLRNFADLYVAMTGDYGFTGRFDPSRTSFAAATTTTLADAAANVMNKVIVQQMGFMDHWRWYERIVDVQPNDGTLNPMKWITIGGIANLPTVAEGAAYTELAVGDVSEADSFTKKGGYVGLTRELIKNSQIQKLQAIPRALATAAVRTRSAAVSYLFTQASGTGPTLEQDSTVLFHSNHSNIATTAIGSDTTAWKAASLECFKHTEVTSGKLLGIFPRFCLVPADLYVTALTIFGYGEGMPTSYQPYAQDRGFQDPRPIPIVVPDWTDATDWAYIVDPKAYPVIQMSYSQAPGGGSHPAPELYSVVSETSGLLFTNDTLPIKVRDEFAVGVNGARGIGKRNVA